MATGLCAVGLASSVGACGSEQPAAGARPAATDSGGPVSIAVEIDGSGSNGASDVRRQYLAAAELAAATYFERGGHLDMRVFSGDLKDVKVYEADLPGPGQMSEAKRAERIVAERDAIDAVLSAVLGLTKPTAEIHDALAGLRPGSAVAANLGAAIDAVRGQRAAVALAVTDGVDSAIDDYRHLSRSQMADRLRALLPSDAAGVTVGVVGVGATTGGVSTQGTLDLLAAWNSACAQLRARACVISSDPTDVSKLFGSGGTG